MRSLDLRGAFRGVRFRDSEIRALDEARQLTHESFSAFVRHAALDQARQLLADESIWDTPQQRRDNAVLDEIQAGLSDDDR